MEPPGHLYRHFAVDSLVGVRSALQRMYVALARLQPLLCALAPVLVFEDICTYLVTGVTLNSSEDPSKRIQDDLDLVEK